MPPILLMVKVALLLAVTIGLPIGLVWLVRKWRGRDNDTAEVASDTLTKYRDMHAQGVLSDFEYRRIKLTLAPKLGAHWPPIESAAAGEQAKATDTGVSFEPIDDGNIDSEPSEERNGQR